METRHRVVVGDSRDMSEIDDDSVDLVVTSPPYPMIEMWDDVFADLNPDIGDQLDTGDGRAAFDLMHQELRKTWREVERVLVDGGICCVNVGDATRKLDSSFRVYQNHSRVVDDFGSLGFTPLPEILWRKPVNSAAKFMGSGMLPPNAYATLEHEYVLVFRKGGSPRSFEPHEDRRYESAYFWEERNRWFTDVWTDVNGALQDLHDDGGELRDRSAAYPFEIPYRLVNMYSVQGDTVLDPFWGTGTTSLAAAAAARDSVGYEIEPEFVDVFDRRIRDVDRLSRDVVERRLDRHRRFVEERWRDGDEPEYESERYGLPVVTKQEMEVRFHVADEVEEADDGYRVVHRDVEDVDELLEEPEVGG